jgi:hypothetical protein
MDAGAVAADGRGIDLHQIGPGAELIALSGLTRRLNGGSPGWPCHKQRAHADSADRQEQPSHNASKNLTI